MKLQLKFPRFSVHSKHSGPLNHPKPLLQHHTLNFQLKPIKTARKKFHQQQIPSILIIHFPSNKLLHQAVFRVDSPLIIHLPNEKKLRFHCFILLFAVSVHTFTKKQSKTFFFLPFVFFLAIFFSFFLRFSSLFFAFKCH
jgi:hypothetical protein